MRTYEVSNYFRTTLNLLLLFWSTSQREKCEGLEPTLIHDRFIFLIHVISLKHLLWTQVACEIWVMLLRKKMTPFQL